MIKQLRNQWGMGFVGQLIAVAVSLGAFSVLMIIMQNAVKNYDHIQSAISMVEAESRLVAYFQNYEALKPSASELKAGRFSAKYLMLNGAKVGRTGAPFFLAQDGRECANSNDPLCQLKIEVQVQCTPVSGVSSCKAAYRISSLKESTVSLGAKHGGPFTTADYVIPISYEVASRAEADGCDPASDLFAAGMNKETGKVWCVRRPQTSCSSGQIAKGFQYNAARGSLEPICEATQTIRCPENYVLNSFRISSLESGKAKVGECVFVTKKEVPWKNPPSPAPSVSGTFCPKFYRTKATCSVRTTSTWNGSCPYSCNCTPSGCQTCYSTSAPANVGAYTLVQGTGQTASCAIRPGPQSCGAGWTGVVVMTGTCELTQPEKVRAL